MTPSELLQRLKAMLAGERTGFLEAFRDGALASDGSASLTPQEIVDHLAPLEAVLVHATCDDASLTTVIEAVDEVTGSSLRESWTFVIEAGFVQKTIVCRGGPLIQARPALAYRQVEPYLAGFDLRYPEPADEAVLRRAADVVSKREGREAVFEHADVLLNEDIVYVPYTWIGCVGFLVDRATWTPVLLGSGIPLRVHVWARYRGFADGDTSAERLNDLVVTAVNNRAATRQALARLRNLPDLDRLPFRLRNIDLYFSREALWKAELKGDFRFQVEPAGGGA